MFDPSPDLCAGGRIEDGACLSAAKVSRHALPLPPPMNVTRLRKTSRPAGSAGKRSLDAVLALGLLLFLTPLLLLVALLVAVESRGPVFFRQRRTGYEGEIFRIYKFRTMRVCEDGPVIRQASRDDERLTRIGALLRKASIDEVPQLINILQGEMSLVGPRPHAVAHDQNFRGFLPDYDRRFEARPGITGLAQLRGQRGETRSIACMAGRVSSDLEYIDTWSLRADLEILLRSFGIPFRSHGY